MGFAFLYDLQHLCMQISMKSFPKNTFVWVSFATVAIGVYTHGHDEASYHNNSISSSAHKPHQLVHNVQASLGHSIGETLNFSRIATLFDGLEPTRSVECL